MKRSWLLSALLAVALLVAACATGPTTRVLFVGNSYTTTNDLPGMVRELASAAGEDIEAGVVAPGGWWWRDHASSSETLGAIRSGEWDFVVLQEQSMVTSLSDMAELESSPAAEELVFSAINAGAQPLLYMTWGHRDGNGEVNHPSYESMQVAIAGTYSGIGRELGIEVAPVGAAWWMARSERPDIPLYQPDGSHPSSSGSYLAAAVIAASILDLDPRDMDQALGLDVGAAEALREFAHRATNGEVPWA